MEPLRKKEGSLSVMDRPAIGVAQQSAAGLPQFRAGVKLSTADNHKGYHP